MGVGAIEISTCAAPAADPRLRRRVLDRVLNELESASESGAATVSKALAARTQSLVTGLAPGMPIRDAIGLVFREQAARLRPAAPRPISVVPRTTGDGDQPAPAAPLDRIEARLLTHRIKTALGDTSMLLLEAHQRRAWHALGHRSWSAYVRAEFGLSRSRSYELLQHGRVIRTLLAAGISAGVRDIHPYTAGQIEQRLDEVIAEIRRRTSADMDGASIRAVVREVIAETRARTGTARGESSNRSRTAARQLGGVIDSIKGLPDVDDLFADLTAQDAGVLAGLHDAVARLRTIAAAWQRMQTAGAEQWFDQPLEAASA
ncbi:MAG TPA: hypothetical protein VN193_14755 [Candidatus Angelobacter sp.]|jgi:hypothetical protein|nr:hypothetical protein [Candidatus Angelobacter sp.]